MVVYYHPDGRAVFAKIVAVTYWDLVDVQLGDGTRVDGVRKAFVSDDGEEYKKGRFDRFTSSCQD